MELALFNFQPLEQKTTKIEVTGPKKAHCLKFSEYYKKTMFFSSCDVFFALFSKIRILTLLVWSFVFYKTDDIFYRWLRYLNFQALREEERRRKIGYILVV